MKRTILIVDDDDEIRVQMKWALGKEYDVVMAEDRESAIEQFKAKRPAVTLLDLGLPPMPNEPDEGLAALETFHALDRWSKVIVISGQGDEENARRAIAAGAHDFFCKPVNTDDLKLLLQRCIYVADLEEKSRKQEPGSAESGIFEGMLGTSAGMREVFSTIKKVAPSKAAVLVLGESGTGKEMVARAIHANGENADGPFVAINCGAIPENLIESELFGHEKGTFTGASTQRKGLIETADGGTLFLDEIGDLPPAMQVKLLRFLQEKRIQRVGGREEIEVEARVIAATNLDLQEEVNEGRFREDLFFRVAVIVCRLPALKDRDEDVLMLARDFLKQLSEQSQRPVLPLSAQAERAILAHHWPGNVRELQNRVQRAVIMADGPSIGVKDLELDQDGEDQPALTLREARENIERKLVEDSLRKHGGKITAVASDLGVSRPTVYELMERLGIERKKSKSK